MNVLIPMAGLGARFSKEGWEEPKPLIKVDGKPLIQHSIETLGVEGKYIFVTRAFDNPEHNEKLTALLKTLEPDCMEIILEEATGGAVETCLAARNHINDDDELIITNCDQILDWDSAQFLSSARTPGIDGAVLTFNSNDPRHSYALIGDDQTIVELREKEPISNAALVGVHYWKNGADFVTSAVEAIGNSDSLKGKECFISESYNHLIKKGKRIITFKIDETGFIPLGTPRDVAVYLGILGEFKDGKPKTIFCDIDGTILRHKHVYSDLETTSHALPHTISKFNEWDSAGHRIILCTSRKESARKLTERQLELLGIPWDQLVMGLTSGGRIVINDKLDKKSRDRAQAINVITDEGFNNVDWEDYEL